MKKISAIIEMEVADDFEPYTFCCEEQCELSYWDYYNDDGHIHTCNYKFNNTCPFYKKGKIINA